MIDKPIADSIAAIVIINIEPNCPKLLSEKNDPYINDRIIDNNIISKHNNTIMIFDLLIEIPNILKIKRDKGKR